MSLVAGSTSPLLRGLIEELLARQRGHGREGVAVGRQWRVVEGPYPASDSPVCVLFQHQDGTEWRTYAAIGPDGVIFSGANRQAWLAAAPVSGSWARGDVVWNTLAAASGTPGWVCVAAGTPGTWKAMANLAA